MRVRSALGRGLAGAFFAITLCLAMSGPADAHAGVVNSNPENGTRLAKLPKQVSITFDENVATPAFVSVTAPDGTNLAVGEPEILDATVTQQIQTSDLSGRYQIAYRVVSADSHPVTGYVTFKIFGTGHVASTAATTPGLSSTTAAQTSGEPFLKNADLVLLILLIVGLVAAGVLSAVRSPGETEPSVSQSEETVGTK